MNNKIISKGLYIEGLRKIKVPAIIFMAVVFLTQAVTPLMQSIAMLAYNNRYSAGVVDALEIMSPLAPVPAVMSPILALVVFYAFNKRSASDYYQSLPYTRTCIFFSWTLSVLTVSTGLIVIGTALGYIVRAFFGSMYVLSASGLIRVLIWYISAMLFTVGCELIAVSVTGTFISNIVCALLLMFLPRMLMVLIRFLVLDLTPVLSSDYSLTWMGFEYNSFFVALIFGFLGLFSITYGLAFSIDDWLYMTGPFVFTVIIALVYIALAAVLFKFRKSETATLSGSTRGVQHIIRIALTFAVSLLGTMFLVNSGSVVIAVVMYSIALIVFFAYEIITTRKWINLVKILPTLLIVAVLNAGVWGFAHLCSNAVTANSPGADDIRSVMMSGTGSDYYSRKVAGIRVSDPTVREVVAEALASDLAAIRDGRYNFTYSEKTELPSGTVAYESKENMLVGIETGRGVMYRSIRFTQSQEEILAAGLANSDEYREAYMQVPEAVIDTMTLNYAYRTDRYGVSWIDDGGFSSEEAEALFDTLQREIAQIGFADWYKNITNGSVSPGSTANGGSNGFIVMRYQTSERGNDTIQINLTEQYTPQSYNTALQMIAGSRKHMDALDSLYTLAEDNTVTDSGSENREQGYYDIDLEILDRDSDGVMHVYAFDVGSDINMSYRDEVFELILQNKAVYSSYVDPDHMVIVQYYADIIKDGEYQDTLSDTVFINLPDDYRDILSEEILREVE